VASVNITNLEDSEALIRAYKKKKQELEECKESYYKVETQLFTERQKNSLLEEENDDLRGQLRRAEKALKDVQVKS